MNAKSMHMVAFLLLVIGGLNWLLFGLFGWDIGRFLGGDYSASSRLIYILVGIAAVYEIATHKANCRTCSTPSPVAPK